MKIKHCFLFLLLISFIMAFVYADEITVPGITFNTDVDGGLFVIGWRNESNNYYTITYEVYFDDGYIAENQRILIPASKDREFSYTEISIRAFREGIRITKVVITSYSDITFLYTD